MPFESEKNKIIKALCENYAYDVLIVESSKW